MDTVSFRKILIIMAACFLGGSVAAQVIVAPSVDDEGRVSIVEVYHDYDDLADEYIEILEDLQDIISDYSEYRDELSPEERALHPLKFDIFVKGLRSGRYDEGHEKLLVDLERFVDELGKLEADHATKEDRKRAKCCRMVRNLRRELDMLIGPLEDYAVQIEARKSFTEAIMVYEEDIARKLESLKVTLSDDENMMTIDLSALKKLEERQIKETMKRLEELRKKGLIPPVPPRRGVPPGTPSGGLWSRYPVEVDVSKGTKREYTASAKYGRSGTTIRLQNSFGDLVVAGWDKEKIAAKLLVAVDSYSSEKEKKFFDNSGIDADESGPEIIISARLPKIRDPGFKLLTSKLVVMVPYDAPVICENSHGQVTVSDLEAGVTIEGDNSQVSVSRILGAVKARNVSGSLVFMGVDGDIGAEVEHGSFVATDCQGSIELDGEHCETSLVGCTGPTNITGIGIMSIVDHFGNLTIKNRKGRVEIDNLDGDLQASNAFQPLIVRRISGTASLENSHSEIRAEGISSKLTVSLSDGKMTGGNLKGPINLVIEKGDVNLSLANRLAGNSTITANHSTLSLSLGDNTDIHFLADISSGTLRTPIPMKIDRKGSSTSAEGKFGRATSTLNVSGNVLTVLINETR